MNRVCEILGCKYPIVEGGLAYVGNGLLAAAVSTGGGFGQVGSGGRSPENLDEEIHIALENTSGPIGVNIPISEHRDPDPYFQVVERHAHRLRAVSLSAGNPRPFIEPLHKLNLKVMTVVSTPAQAVKAEQAGADILICEGTEAGGHNGPRELTTFSLVPNVVDVVSVPVIAAGGIADGRTAAAALCLGAEGVQLGTRFVATRECQAHPRYKEALLSATVEDTVVMERSLGRVTRVLRSPYVDKILQQERETPGDLERLLPMISGRMNAVAALDGRMEEGWVNCGQSVGLVKQLAGAAEVVQQLVQEMDAALAALRSWRA
jgi:NAD(P)H-dependent flavin oxidoreductase YrpB (nitropropane dioxygenase family)